MRAAGALSVALLVAACGTAPLATPGPTATPTPPPTPTPGPATPVATATTQPTATSSVTAFDGVWASRPLTRDMMVNALTQHGLDASRFDEFFPDSDRVDYRMAEASIDDGHWRHFEYADNVWIGGWDADIVEATVDTVAVSNPNDPCDATFALTRSGNELTVSVVEAACPDDLLYEVAMYEAAPFTLIQEPDWKPADFEASPAIEIGPSTSAARQVARPIGIFPKAPLGYLEYLPPSYSESGAPSPLILFFHGSGESGNGTEAELNRLRQGGIPDKIANLAWPDDRPFVVLSPQHDDSEPPDFCMEADEIFNFIEFAVAHYNVDVNRIYLTGLSCGAIGIWNYLGKYGGESIAAAVPIAGNGLTSIQNQGCDLASMPIWAFHGWADQNVPVEGEVYPLTVLQGCTDPVPTDARLTVFPLGSHDVWTRTYGGSDGIDIYGWLLEQSLPR